MKLSEETLELSTNDGDSNALIIIPGKKKSKSKISNRSSEKTEIKKEPKLSKSHKRKLKKLEEEREKETLLLKSLETLEKHKLPEDAYSLLKPSHTVGRAETVIERRRRAVNFSKAGLDDPYSGQVLRKGDNGNAAQETEHEFSDFYIEHNYEKNCSVEPMIIEPSKPNNFIEKPITNQEIGIYGGAAFSSQDRKVEDKYADTYKPAKARNSSPPRCTIDKENTHLTDTKNEDVKAASSKISNSSESSLQRPLTTTIVVHVSRPTEVEDNRKNLPIVMREQEIMESINYNPAVIICGETGCGKTTQVPQFLYEAGFGSNLSIAQSGIIGVTQPRRVAVLSTARRVAFELGLHLGKEVGFQVRHDKQVGENCSIKFMTDGVLLRELQNDLTLRRYSVIILDEAHERSLNTDILIGMLSRVIEVRQKLYEEQQQCLHSGKSLAPENMIFPLKLVLMSATLRVEDFVSGRRLFRNPPPVLEVEARQYKVTVHHSKRTEVVDYIGQAYKKVLSIHKKLPQGGILVFVTGQREVEYLCRKLRKASRELVLNSARGHIGGETTPSPEISSYEGVNMVEISEASEMHGNSPEQLTDRFSSYDEGQYDLNGIDSDSSYESGTESEEEIIDDNGTSSGKEIRGNNANILNDLGQLKAAFEALPRKTTGKSTSEGKQSVHVTPYISSGCSDFSMVKGNGAGNGNSIASLRVLPLYAMLPAAAQLRVFEEVKEGERLVVVATNVAETSLTIPGIKYVVDTGRAKVKTYNSTNGMETYEIQWISKASAAQRAGRAGRTADGHCYRLYSSAVYHNIFPEFSCAEISKVPVEGVVLLLKSMQIDKVANFPFPTPPETTALAEAERCLKALEALDSSGRLTPLGKAMAYYPMSPRHSRMLLTVIQIMRKVKNNARGNLILGYAVAAAAALSLSNPFLRQFEGSPTNKDELERGEISGTVGCESGNELEKSKKKKLKEAAKAARAKFLNPSSDALSVAYALQCFELSRSPVDFCNDNALHLKTMEEMSKLRKQLLQLVFHHSCGFCEEFTWIHGTLEDVENAWRVSSNKHPLLLNEEEVLSQAICAGWADRVAKRIRGNSGLLKGDRKVNAVRYQACLVKETVFLHRWSSVSKSAPEYLVYSELIHTKRPYMHGATSVRPDWLVKYAGSLCNFSAPLADPKPYYEAETDQVFCWVAPSFGPHLWELPLRSLPVKNVAERVVVFAYALFDGQVLPCLKSVRKLMAAPPGSILRPEASGQRRVGNLIAKFRAMLIDSCAMLREVWNENPRELRREILDWFQEGFRTHFEELWSQMLSEARLEAQERFPRKIKRVRRGK